MAKYNENILDDMNTFVYKKSNWKRITLPNDDFWHQDADKILAWVVEYGKEVEP